MDIPPGCVIEGTTFGHCPHRITGEFAIPDGVTDIGHLAFASCAFLTSIHIPESVTKIDDSAFSACHSLASINIPEGVTEIGKWAFSGCNKLTCLIIPKACSVAEHAFPPSCKIFKGSVAEYREHLVKNLVEERAGDGVDIVGMLAPTALNTVDSRCGRDI